MTKKVLAAALLAFTACASPQTLAPGPGPTTPHFSDEGHWVASDGYVLGLSQWQAKNPATVIVALHGMNDYGRFIDGAAKYWQSHGITTYAYDQRGFGRTEGNGRWPGHEVMAKDARTFVALVRSRHPKARVILLGESMGGAVAMLAAAQNAAPVADVLVLVSPALWGWSNLDVFKRSGLWLAMQVAPGGRLSGRGLNIKPSDNEQMLLALGRDPYVIKSTRIDALYGLVDLMEAASVSVPAIALPTMVLYATGDEVVPSEPIRNAAAAMPGAKHVVCYGDGFHMLLRDLAAQRTWDEIESFARGSAQAKPSPCP
jgi:alpha-beta hydrolase superfamily lysophospholipase